MRFEHLVQINDVMNPLIEPLTRDALWSGLMHSIEEPQRFIDGLDAMTVLSRDDGTIERELRFGPALVHDRVRAVPGERLEIVARGTASRPEAQRTITLEEKPPGDLYARFVYEVRPQGHAPHSAEDAAFLRQAWLRTDLDLIARIREWHGERCA